MPNFFDEIIKIISPLLDANNDGYFVRRGTTAYAETVINKIYTANAYIDGTISEKGMSDRNLDAVTSVFAYNAFQKISSTVFSLPGYLSDAFSAVSPNDKDLTNYKTEQAAQLLWDFAKINQSNKDQLNNIDTIKSKIDEMLAKLMQRNEEIQKKEVDADKGAAELDNIFLSYQDFFYYLKEERNLVIINKALIYNCEINEEFKTLSRYYNLLTLSLFKAKFDSICATRLKKTRNISENCLLDFDKTIRENLDLLNSFYTKNFFADLLANSFNSGMQKVVRDLKDKALDKNAVTLFDNMIIELNNLRTKNNDANVNEASINPKSTSSYAGIMELVYQVHALNTNSKKVTEGNGEILVTGVLQDTSYTKNASWADEANEAKSKEEENITRASSQNTIASIPEPVEMPGQITPMVVEIKKGQELTPGYQLSKNQASTSNDSTVAAVQTENNKKENQKKNKR